MYLYIYIYRNIFVLALDIKDLTLQIYTYVRILRRTWDGMC